MSERRSYIGRVTTIVVIEWDTDYFLCEKDGTRESYITEKCLTMETCATRGTGLWEEGERRSEQFEDGWEVLIRVYSVDTLWKGYRESVLISKEELQGSHIVIKNTYHDGNSKITRKWSDTREISVLDIE